MQRGLQQSTLQSHEWGRSPGRGSEGVRDQLFDAKVPTQQIAASKAPLQ